MVMECSSDKFRVFQNEMRLGCKGRNLSMLQLLELLLNHSHSWLGNVEPMRQHQGAGQHSETAGLMGSPQGDGHHVNQS